MRRILLLVVAAALLAPAALAKSTFPDTIPLPNGWQPEGIAIGTGTSFYAGSRATGAVYAGDLRTGAGKVLIQGAAGRAATGMKVDHGRLWVSGAGTGKGTVYDLKTGARRPRVPARAERRRRRSSTTSSSRTTPRTSPTRSAPSSTGSRSAGTTSPAT